MTGDFSWASGLELDVEYGFVNHRASNPPLQHNPRIVLNDEQTSVLRAIRHELVRCTSFTFSVAFISPAAIAMLKQDLLDFAGAGRIVTSDYLGFNQPAAFAELLNLADLGFDVRLHNSEGFHPKGYVFEHANTVTAMVGSSNLTPTALVRNHEWNLQVSAAAGSDLAAQIRTLLARQLVESVPISAAWVAEYARSYSRPPSRPPRVPHTPALLTPGPLGRVS